jgi:hypothetical protein
MKVEQRVWSDPEGWKVEGRPSLSGSAQLVFVFGKRQVLRRVDLLDDVRHEYPNAHMFGCSTAGEILGAHVYDGSLVVTAVRFDNIQLRGKQLDLDSTTNSYAAGEYLARALPASIRSSMTAMEDGLEHVIVFSDGLNVNGSELVNGLTENLPESVTITGGLAGDGEAFGETVVFWDSDPKKNAIAIMGLYGDRLHVGFSSMGGWGPFGHERLVTRSKGNILYELDGQSALGLYKKYLGDHARELPASGLLFPLSVRTKSSDPGLVRTILSVNEEEQSMTFAGDVPEGSYARLMKANVDRLIDGAIGAAKVSRASLVSARPEFAILVSCVGRKLLMKQRTEEEVEGVKEIFGGSTVITGFYSYGEISPFAPGVKCELHNQSMTITVISEG